MSDQDEQKYGLEGIEQSQGYSPMPMANPDPEPALSDEQVAHFNRPAPPPPVERAYNDVQTGEPTPDNQTVEIERASRDISEIRAAERAALEQQRNADLNEALDHLGREEAAQRAATTPAQPEITSPPRLYEQPAEPQPALTAEQFGALDLEQQNAYVEQADRQLQSVLADPIIRERIESEFTQVRTQAAAEVEAARSGYGQATAALVTESVAMIAALFPEFQNLNLQQMQGAVAVMAKSQPERVQQLAQLLGRTQNIAAAHQQQQFAEQQRQAQLQAQWLQQYKIAEDLKWEESVARDRSPEQIKALRENALPLVERHYGIRPEQFRAIYSGEERVDGATFMRSAPFQLMLSDALSYRMSKEAVGRAVSRNIPNVQRPGSSGEAVTRTQAALAEAQSKLKPAMSAKEAAAYLIARRAAR
jgi:hypothetical protein